MDTSSLMEQILNNDNLKAAYLQVVRNKDAVGVDEHIVKRTISVPCNTPFPYSRLMVNNKK